MENERVQQLVERADALYLKGQAKEALAAYRAVLAEDPENPRAYSRIGALYAQAGDMDSAKAALDQALLLDPQLATAHSNLGNVYFAQGDPAQALKKYQEAIALDAQNPIFQQNLHAAYKKLGMYSEAVAAIKQSHRLGRTQAREEAQTVYRSMKKRAGCLGPSAILLMITASIFAIFH